MSNALKSLEAYYEDYGSRLRVLKKEGKKVMGYVSAVAPLEIISAAGYVPVRIKGSSRESVTKAYAMMETLVCPYLLSAFDENLKGKYDYLDGIVIPHTCDSVSRTYEIWKHNVPLPYYHFLNVPHLDDAPSLQFFKEILRTFIKSLEQAAGVTISRGSLKDAVSSYNAQRRAMRDLYSFLKPDKPLISGVEMMKLMTAVKALPVDESTALVRKVIEEIKERKTDARQKPLRIMVIGDQIDNTDLVEIVENFGAQVVMDDISIGSKLYFADVEETPDPIDGLAEYYLRKISLPTFYRHTGAGYEADLEMRFGYLKNFISGFHVDGTVLLVYRNCDPYGFEVPAVISFIEALGVPVFYLEDDYHSSSLGNARTRIEAFLETLEQKRM